VWESPDDRLRGIETQLQGQHARVLRGGDFDRWDLEVRGGMFGAARLLMAVEDHGSGRQLVRVRCWPRCLERGVVAAVGFGSLAEGAALDGAWTVAAILAAGFAVVAIRALLESGRAMAALAGVADLVLDSVRTNGEGL
jgi:hypothetical protein